MEDLYFGVVRLRTFENSANERMKATGFFYANKAEKTFLITNRHVVIGDDYHPFYNPVIMKMLMHIDKDDLKKNRDIEIQLYDKDGKRRWLEHPTIPSDVVAIPMKDEDFGGLVYSGKFGEGHLLSSKHTLFIGHDVIILGYPLGMWYDEKNNLPTIRSGTVASNYSVPYNDNPYFLVEANLHEGTSGAPVLTKPGTTILEDGLLTIKDFPHLIGINSSTFPYPPGEQPSNYNAVYPTRIIDEIVNTV